MPIETRRRDCTKKYAMKKELGGVAPFSRDLWWDGSSSSVTDVGQLDPGQKLKRLSHPHASDLVDAPQPHPEVLRWKPQS
jgi:hypothetical protein